MALSQAQLASLKAFIQGDPTLSSYGTGPDAYHMIAQDMNKLATPAFIIWRTRVVITEIMESPGFDWTRVDNLTVGKARIWDWLVKLGTINPSLASIRAGIDATWSAGGDLATKDAIYAKCKAEATVAEKLFATGTGTTNSPATSAFYDGWRLLASDVDQALNLPD